MKLLILLTLIGAVAGKPAAAPLLFSGGASDPTGIYGNVQDSPETGDMGGYELRFFRRNGMLMVELTLCEGWCNETYTAPVVRDGRAYVVRYDEMQLDQAGRGQRVPNRLRLAPSRGGFLISHWMNGRAVGRGLPPVHIRRQRNLYGLAVARDNMRECRRSHSCAGG